MPRRDALPSVDGALLERLDIAAPRYTSYPTVPEWGPFKSADADAALARAGGDPAPLSLYVHIPFCESMCTYCGCHVIVAKDARKADPYVDLLAVEAERVRAALGGRRAVSRLHLGGGTPTFLDERQLADLHRALSTSFDFLPDAELALEVDPAVTRASQLELLAGLGFRRISMGVQDLDPEVQRAVARIQTEEQTRAAIDTARAAGFTGVNLDLIYGLPRQTPESWRRTIDRIVAIRPDRVSLFSFAHVPSVKPHQRRLQVAELPTGAAKHQLFRLGHEGLVAAGYRAIGMDHFALPDDELSIAMEEGRLWRDFQGYSAGRGGAGTIALGVSAIGDVAGTYLQNVKTLPRYAAALKAGDLPVERGFRRSAADDRRRALIGELMCNLRVQLADDEVAGFGPELARLRDCERDGLCTVDGGLIEITPLGRIFVRNVASAFDTYLHESQGPRRSFSKTI